MAIIGKVIKRVEALVTSMSFEKQATAFGTSTNVAINLSTFDVGRVAYVGIIHRGTGASGSSPSGWNLERRVTQNVGNTHVLEVWRKELAVGDIGTLTWGFGASTAFAACAVQYTGADGAYDTPSVEWKGVGLSTTVTFSAVAPGVGDEKKLMIGAMGIGNTWPAATAGGATRRSHVSAPGVNACIAFYEIAADNAADSVVISPTAQYGSAVTMSCK